MKGFMKPSLIRFSFFLVFLLIFNGLLSSQTKEQESIRHEVTVTVKLIQVYVLDKNGNPVSDLNQSDFEVYDNGKPQKISYFEKHIITIPKKKEEIEKILPEEKKEIKPSHMNRKFFLFFDFAFNTPAGIMRAKRAALHFLDTLNPDDEVGILTYSAKKGLTMQAYLTKDHRGIRKVLEGIGMKGALEKAEDVKGEHWTESAELWEKAEGGGKFSKEANTRMAEMAVNAREFERRIYASQAMDFTQTMKELAKALRYIPGVKHVVLFSSGVANFILFGGGESSSELSRTYKGLYRINEFEEMAKELSSSNSPVISINTEGQALSSKSNEFLGDGSLRYLSKLSGGKYFDNINSYKMITEEIQKMTGTYYVLGYTISETYDGKFHEIKVKVKRKDCEVFGQKGYFSPKPFTEFTETEKFFHLIDLALSEKPIFQEPIKFPLKTFLYFENGKSFCVFLSRVSKELIKEIGGAKGEIATLILGKEWNIIGLKKKEANFTQFHDDLYFHSILPISSGEYGLRVVLRNLDNGKGAVGSSEITIPEIKDSNFRISSPLLLKLKEKGEYLEGPKEEKSMNLFTLYPFDPERYEPILDELKKKTKLFCMFSISIGKIENPDISFFLNLRNLSSGENFFPSFSIIDKAERKDTLIYLLEIPIENLPSGKYSLYTIAEERGNKLRASTNTIFEVK